MRSHGSFDTIVFLNVNLEGAISEKSEGCPWVKDLNRGLLFPGKDSETRTSFPGPVSASCIMWARVPLTSGTGCDIKPTSHTKPGGAATAFCPQKLLLMQLQGHLEMEEHPFPSFFIANALAEVIMSIRRRET